jgi:hypothetical protein
LTRFALAAALALALPAQAQVYKCVDERGVTHYTDKPRPGCKGGKVDIRPIPPVSGKTAPAPSSSIAGQDADFKRRQIEREQAEAQEKTALAQRCARLRNEHSLLASGVRVYKTNERGEPVFIEDATRDTRLAQLKDALRGCP